MSKQKSFLKCWLFVCWLPLLGALIAIPIQSLRITSKPQQYISLAKLVAGGRMAGGGAGPGVQYQEYLADFYGTIIETIESSEMRRRALDRMRALHPDLKDSEVGIHVSQNKGSSIFNVRAFGAEPKYTRIFLDALLDEFIAFRNQIREQQRNKALTAMAEDVVRREKSLQEKGTKLTDFEKANNMLLLPGEVDRLTKRALKLRDERDDLSRKTREIQPTDELQKQLTSAKEELARIETELEPLARKVPAHDVLVHDYQDSKRAYDDILELVRRFTVGEDMTTDHVTIMERASGAVEDLQEWILPIAAGAIAGGLAGLLLSLLIAALIHGASPSTQPPSLPTVE